MLDEGFALGPLKTPFVARTHSLSDSWSEKRLIPPLSPIHSLEPDEAMESAENLETFLSRN